jgi:uncharacterized protein with von Willebrand factor type A (vWA) domain
MRHRFHYLDPELLRQLLAGEELQRIFNQLVLAASGDVEQAMDWLRHLQEEGYLNPDVDLEAFFESLQENRSVAPDGEGNLVLTAGGERRIRKTAFEQIFSSLRSGGPGYHPVRSAGDGVERLPETRSYRFGDEIHHLDAARSLQNALKRSGGSGFSLAEEDLEVHETEPLTACATIVAIDVSHSMVLYGEDRITPAKTVALALTELITSRYPKDYLGALLFGDRAEVVPLSNLPYIEAGPFHTNTAEALEVARGMLARQRQPNKQIFLITDGKPSAMTVGQQIYKNPFGLDMRIVTRTLEEADACRRQEVVITTFMIATDPLLTEFVEKMTQVNRGRAYFASPERLGEFILADYIRHRRRRLR